MRATAFFISLCLFLLVGNTLDAGAVSYANKNAVTKNNFQQALSQNQFAFLENAGQANPNSFLFYEEVDDEDEKNSLAKKHKEQNRFIEGFSAVRLLHSYNKAPYTITACSNAGASPKYILLRTLRI